MFLIYSNLLLIRRIYFLAYCVFFRAETAEVKSELRSERLTIVAKEAEIRSLMLDLRNSRETSNLKIVEINFLRVKIQELEYKLQELAGQPNKYLLFYTRTK